MIEYLERLCPWTLIYVFAIIGTLFSITKIEKDSQRLYTSKSVQIIRVWMSLMNVFIFVVLVMASYEICTGLKDFKWTLLLDIILLIVILSEMGRFIKINKTFFRSTNKIIATCYALLAEDQFEKGSDTEAIKSIEKACDLDSEEPLYWLIFSKSEMDAEKAKGHIQKAENLIEKKGLESEKIFALVEFYKGLRVLIDTDSKKLALEHFNKSLELNYDKKRADFIQKIEDAKGKQKRN